MNEPVIPNPNSPTGPDGPDLTSPDAAGRATPGQAPPPGSNQPKAEPAVPDGDVPATGTVGVGDPQAPSPSRIAHESDLPGGLAAAAIDAPADASREQGQPAGPGDPKDVSAAHTDAAPGTSEAMTSTQAEPGER